ncbi:MAG TPA: glycosyltransferase [Terriglobales bacterium]|jgi:glycosyltransferase involved in cell wall biosynthesis|nr:glycosyltransferase [Terriglobales bacterium]
MRVAVVHDYFTQHGGAEKVAEELYSFLPDPDLFATLALPAYMPPRLQGVNVQTSWMQKLPRIRDYYRLYFFLYPFAVGSLDLSAYDLIVSSSSGYAKGVRASANAIHVCYCHTPMRWAWNYQQYANRESFGLGQRAILPLFVRGLQHWDAAASRQPDHFVANSKSVAERIRWTYQRTAEVIHPPVETERFHLSNAPHDDYYLVLSRLVSYKRIDIAVQACRQRGKRLLVIGEGPDRQSLEAMAGDTIKFLGRASDAKVEYHAARCRALLFPGEEDFGMAPVEVAAAGRPTIAFRAGGALETIVEGRTGVFFDQQTPESLGDAIERFERLPWSSTELRKHSRTFSAAVFRDRFRAFLNRVGARLDSAPSDHGLDTVARWRAS